MASDLKHNQLRFRMNTGRTANAIVQEQSYIHSTGDSIPAMGCGTWHVKGAEATESVKIALQAGYRHVDTAYAYGNEKEVGEGIRASGIPREEIWLTSKVCSDKS